MPAVSVGQEKKPAAEDLIVHNMPSPVIPLASKPALTPAIQIATPVSPQGNFKRVGLLIMVGGLVFLFILAYISYIYIIKPASKSGAKVAVTAPIESVSSSTPGETVASAPANEENAASVPTTIPAAVVATSVPAVFDLTATAAEETATASVSLLSLEDSDNDGFYDNEEMVLGANPNRADTDNDGYDDLAEISNGYDPLSAGKLTANQNLVFFSSVAMGYEILAPKNWPEESLNNEATVVFSAPDDSLVQISVADNTDGQSILSWYGDSFPNDTVTYERLKSADGWDGVWGEDGLNFYLTDKSHKNIYVISYIPAISDRVAYPNIYQLMLNSFVLK